VRLELLLLGRVDFELLALLVVVELWGQWV